MSYTSQLCTTHCEHHNLLSLVRNFFSSFLYKGAWKRDRKIFLAIFYGIYVGTGSLENKQYVLIFFTHNLDAIYAVSQKRPTFDLL